MRFRQIFAGLILTLITFSASALDRQFPANAKRGMANFSAYPKLFIDGQQRRAGPGLRIWNTKNTIPFRSSLHGENVVINYTVDGMKMIDRIWILTPAEAAKPLASQVSRMPATATTTTSTTTTQVP